MNKVIQGDCLEKLKDLEDNIAAKQEGFNYIGIERESDYVKIAEARLKAVDNSLNI